jgi:DNA-binding transcriptional regulator WhiA
MKLANILDSKSSAARLEGSSPSSGTDYNFLKYLAYIIGVAIGDGNLSNPNGRSVRLRISCDTKYPEIIKEISSSLKVILPENKVSLVKKKCNCVDISCYSRYWEKWLGWKHNKGPKYEQSIKIPKWIKNNSEYSESCLKGLFQTDGCIYFDRGYIMVNFVTTIQGLDDEVVRMITKLGFKPKLYTLDVRDNMRHKKYTVRISKNVMNFIKAINLTKT